MDAAAARAKLSILAQANGDVSLGPTGAAAVVTRELLAYRELAAERALLVGLRRELDELSGAGPGARRVYAALLLGSIDEEAGRAALEAMCGSDEPCALFPGGCSSVSQWLGETASYLLGRPAMDPRRVVAAPREPAQPREGAAERGWLLRALERILNRL